MVYEQRRKVLDGEDLTATVEGMLSYVVSSHVSTAMSQSGQLDEETAKELLSHFEGIFFAKGEFTLPEDVKTPEQAEAALLAKCKETYAAKEAKYGEALMRELERVILLRVVDEYWMDNIDAMDDLKQGITLRSYAQEDPVVAYRREGYEMFEAMINAMKEETIRRLFLAQIKTNEEIRREKVAKEMSASSASDKTVKKQPVRKTQKVGPNDPCPCGSGKKYKKCCMTKDQEALRNNG